MFRFCTVGSSDWYCALTNRWLHDIAVKTLRSLRTFFLGLFQGLFPVVPTLAVFIDYHRQDLLCSSQAVWPFYFTAPTAPRLGSSACGRRGIASRIIVSYSEQSIIFSLNWCQSDDGQHNVLVNESSSIDIWSYVFYHFYHSCVARAGRGVLF